VFGDLRARVCIAVAALHNGLRALKPLSNSVAGRQALSVVHSFSAQIDVTVGEHAFRAVRARSFGNKGGAHLRLEAGSEETLSGFNLGLLLNHCGRVE